MSLFSLNSKSSWVDPRSITRELSVDYPQNHQTINMARYLKELWLYKFGEQNTKFMQEHPKEFLEMYSTLSAQHQYRTSQLPQPHSKNEPSHNVPSEDDQPNTRVHPFPDYTNVLSTTPWHDIYVLGCLRHIIEHRLPIHSCEALTKLPAPTTNQLLTDLYCNVSYNRHINGFTAWLKEQDGVDDVLQGCLLHDLYAVISAMDSNRPVYRHMNWQDYAHLTLNDENEQQLYHALLFDTLFDTSDFASYAEQYFPTYTAHFQQWWEWMTSLDSNRLEDLAEEELHGDQIFVHLSDHAYTLLQTIPKIHGFNAPLVTSSLENIFQSP